VAAPHPDADGIARNPFLCPTGQLFRPSCAGLPRSPGNPCPQGIGPPRPSTTARATAPPPARSPLYGSQAAAPTDRTEALALSGSADAENIPECRGAQGCWRRPGDRNREENRCVSLHYSTKRDHLTHVPHVDVPISASGRCPGHPSRMTKRPYAGIGPTKPCVAGVYPACRKTGRSFRPPAGIPYGSARSGEIGGRFGDRRAPDGSRDSPVSIFHILASVLAAHSSSGYLLEEELLPPVEFGRANVCRTVGFPGRLRQNPAGKPDGR